MTFVTLAPFKDNQFSTPAGNSDTEGSLYLESQKSAEPDMCNAADQFDVASYSSDLKKNGHFKGRTPFFCDAAHAGTLIRTYEVSNYHFSEALEQSGELQGWRTVSRLIFTAWKFPKR